MSGLSGTVALQDNGGDTLSVSANGSFTFATLLAPGQAYNVTVATNPSGQVCTVSNGAGTVPSSNVTNVTVSCTTQSSGSGSGSGSSASDTFARANGSLGANWTDMTDGGLAISSQVVVGTAVGNSGDMWTANSFTGDQSSQVAVTSTPLTGNEWIGPVVRAQNGGQSLYVGIYFWNSGSPELMLFKRIGGGWTQLGSPYQSGAPVAGTQLELTAVGSSLQFSENGVVEITASDTSLTGGAPGIMANGGATGGSWSGGSVVGTESIGGSVSGLSGTVALQDNGGDTLSVSANGSFTFATLLAPGQAYNVTVATNPSGQVCTVSNGAGTVPSSNVTNVTVSCANRSVSIGGSVSGLSGTVLLQDNGGDTLSVSANGSFTFATLLAPGQAYNVTVATNPSGQVCTVSNGAGTASSSNVTNVTVSCAAQAPGSARVGHLRPAEREPRSELDGHDRRGTGDLLSGRRRDDQRQLRRHVDGELVHQRSVLPDHRHVDAADRQPVDRPGREGAERRSEPLRRVLLLEQWQPGADAVQADQRELDPTRRPRAVRPAASRDPAGADGGRLHPRPPGERGGGDHHQRPDTDRRGAGHPGEQCGDRGGAGSAETPASRSTTRAPTRRVSPYYDVISDNNGYGAQAMRVLQPTHPAAGVAHNFLYVLPVEAGLGNSFGDGLADLQALDAEDQYNVTIIEPTFYIQPWYANDPPTRASSTRPS